MTSPFVFSVHKDFAQKMKETGCSEQEIASHLQEVLLEDNEIQRIIAEVVTADDFAANQASSR